MRDKSVRVLSYVAEKGWLAGDLQCSFLAAGEYNENYRVSDGVYEYVFRINHGTQLGLVNQIEYEFLVLQMVSPSGVTPRPHRYSLDAEGLGEGVLLMEYIPGRALDYGRDLETAADIFARIHRLPPKPGLIVQADPVRDIAAESLRLVRCYDDNGYHEVRRLLLEYHEKIIELADSSAGLFANEPFCVVNTEVNSGNFLIHPDRSCLVDWEKAVLSCRYQDLAHFLVATTTLWKTDCRLDDEQKREFLNSYRLALGGLIPLDELWEKTRLMERVILLRALSWCYMAWHEYTGRDRQLAHGDTFRKIVSYLDEARCFLQ
jgi:aminoglycoside phosphotransferase (APT) family kinase protein